MKPHVSCWKHKTFVHLFGKFLFVWLFSVYKKHVISTGLLYEQLFASVVKSMEVPCKIFLIVFSVFLSSGCTPTCETTCDKLLTCGEIDGGESAVFECENSCMAKQELYNSDWDDEEKQQGFDDLKSCLVNASCEDIALGECYNKDLYIW